ncbi:DUF4259 domain-containing protein [bacterium]|nr:DUF4259 domain-containing protein [bacterium]
MSVWGHEIFDNDSACDWQEKLLASEGLSMVEGTLGIVAQSTPEDTKLVECCQALAACEALAHLRGKPGLHETSLDALAQWAQRNRGTDTAGVVPLAKQALQRILSKDCPLNRYWQDSPAADKSLAYQQWLATVDDVAARID